jgi:kumamolisin
MLDIYCAGGVVPKAKIVYYVGPNTFQGFYNVILAAAMDSVNRPSALGISWAANESYFGQDLFATAFQSGIAVGMVCFSSSGDSGAANLVPIYPSSSAYQISAGGTNIGISGGNLIGESAWGGTGGGISNFIARPTWQNGLTFRTINSSNTLGAPTALPKRGYPDMSAPADPYTGYQFYINGGLNQYGGTSAAAPFLAGMITRLNTLLGKRIGFANTIFYANPTAFTDTTTGDNRAGGATGYATTPGWDAVTGLGSPIGSAIYKLFNTGSTFPKQNYGFRPTATQTGIAYPRKSIRVK